MAGWIRLNVDFWRHPKTKDLSKDAKQLFIAGLTRSAEHSTDGYLSAADVRIAAAEADVRPRAVNELVAGGRWHVAPTDKCECWTSFAEEDDRAGYRIHDYLEYQESSTEREAKKAAHAERMRKWRHRDMSRDTSRNASRAPARDNGGDARSDGVGDGAVQVQRDLSPSVVNHQVSRAHEEPRQGSADGDSSNGKPQVNPSADPLASRWVGLFKPSRHDEAIAVLQRCRKHVAEHVIDQAIGRGIAADTHPKSPRWLLTAVANEVSQAQGSFADWREIVEDLTGKASS